MIVSVKKLLASPTFATDDEKTRKAALLNTILLAGFALTTLYLMALPVFIPQENPTWALIRYPLLILTWVLLKRGQVRAACVFFVVGTWAIQAFVWGATGGLQPVSIAGVIIRVLITGLLLGGRLAFFYAALSLVQNALISWMIARGLFPLVASPYTPTQVFIEQAIWSFLAAILLSLWMSSLNQALRRARDELTERKRVEEQLRATEQRFSKAFKSSPNPMGITTLAEGRFVEVNENFLHTTGYSREELIGQTVAAIRFWGNPDDRVKLLEMLERQEDVRNIEMLYRMKSGEERVMLVSAEIIELDGELCLLAVGSDITDRKQAEEALRATEERFSKAFNASPMPMAIHSLPDIRYIDVNDAFVHTGEFTREQVIGRTWSELNTWVDPQQEEQVVQALRNLGGRVRNMESKFRCKGGEVRVGMFSSESITLDGKECLLSVVNDITERKQAEEKEAQLQEAIHKSAMEWRRTFDSVESVLMILDLDGRIIRLNRTAKELSGFSYEKIVDRTLESIGDQQPWQEAAKLVSLMRESRRTVSSQTLDESGGKAWDISANMLSGFNDRIIIVARDITGMVKLQASLRRSETMSAMGALVAGVAHEVRNPLFSISATLDAFEARFGQRQEYQQHLNILRGEVKRLNDLMGDLLEYGKPFNLELLEGAIPEVVGRAIRLCEGLVKRSNVTIINRITNGLTPILMDRRRVIQVFQNVIQNAIQHSTAGASVTIEAEQIDQDSAPWIHCRISDSGPGFCAEELPKIFEPFFTRRRGGTGIGLSIVQRIMEEHGGKVLAANRSEGGAVVELRFQAVKS